MFNPLPVMRTTKVLAILSLLFFSRYLPMGDFGIFSHPFFSFPLVILLFEVIVYKVLHLKDSSFVPVKKLRKIYKTSQKNLDFYVSSLINTKILSLVVATSMVLFFKNNDFILLFLPIYLFVFIVYVRKFKIITSFGNWGVVFVPVNKKIHDTRKKTYDHYLSTRLHGVFRS